MVREQPALHVGDEAAWIKTWDGSTDHEFGQTGEVVGLSHSGWPMACIDWHDGEVPGWTRIAIDVVPIESLPFHADHRERWNPDGQLAATAVR